MTRWAARTARTVARAILLFGLWMVLVDNLHQAELVTGAVAAVAGAILWTTVTVAVGEPAWFSPRMLRYLYRPFLLLVADTARVLGALFGVVVLRRKPGGGFRAVRYRATSADPGDRARRILTEWGTSLAANRYAIGIDPDEGYLLIHELVPGSGTLDPLELG